MSRFMLALFCVVALAAPAFAGDNITVWPDPVDWYGQQWTSVYANGGSFSLTHEYGTLRYSGSADGSENDPFAAFVSVKPVSLQQDFTMRAHFVNDYGWWNVGSEVGEGGVDFGLIKVGADMKPAYQYFAEASNYVTNYGNNIDMKFKAGKEGAITEEFKRQTSADTFQITYDASEDLARFSLLDTLSGTEVAYSTYQGIRAEAGDYLNVLLSAYNDKDNNSVGSELMFTAVDVKTAPEPLSCALFVIGGGALAIVRRRNKK